MYFYLKFPEKSPEKEHSKHNQIKIRRNFVSKPKIVRKLLSHFENQYGKDLSPQSDRFIFFISSA